MVDKKSNLKLEDKTIRLTQWIYWELEDKS